MAEKRNQDYIKKNNLEIHQATIERQGEHIAKYNISCRRLERKIADKDEFIKELKSTITDLKTASIYLELESKKKKKKKTSLSKKQQKQMMKLFQQMKDSSEEESSSSDEDF